MRTFTAVALAALAGGFLAACGGPSGGEGTIQAAGAVRVTDPSGAVVQGTRLATGDRVTVGRGSAVVTLARGGRVELRTGSVVRFSGGPHLDSGDLLAESASHHPVEVATAIGDVAVTGAARVHRDLAVEVGTYQGRATVSAGRTVTVPALTEDGIPAVGVVPDPVPLQLSANDAWDERFLGAAIELTSQLDSDSRYVTANTPPGEARSVSFYRRALGARAAAPAFTDDLLRVPPTAGDALVDASIALASSGPFQNRWTQVVDLRTLGASWGIVVLDEGADPATVTGLVTAALDGAAAPAAQAAPASGPGSGPSGVATPATAGSEPATTGAPAATTPTRSTPVTTTATTTVPPLVTLPTIPTVPTTTTPTTTPLAPVIDPVVGLINSLLP